MNSEIVELRTSSGEYHNAELQPRGILLKLKIPIGSEENIEAVFSTPE
jgi:hypothetical protein